MKGTKWVNEFKQIGGKNMAWLPERLKTGRTLKDYYAGYYQDSVCVCV